MRSAYIHVISMTALDTPYHTPGPPLLTNSSRGPFSPCVEGSGLKVSGPLIKLVYFSSRSWDRRRAQWWKSFLSVWKGSLWTWKEVMTSYTEGSWQWGQCTQMGSTSPLNPKEDLWDVLEQERHIMDVQHTICSPNSVFSIFLNLCHEELRQLWR